MFENLRGVLASVGTDVNDIAKFTTCIVATPLPTATVRYTERSSRSTANH
jgi:hypothetical protein